VSTPTAISEELTAFIREKIDSVQAVEILACLGLTPDRSWSTVEIANCLYLQEDSVRGCLTDLVDHGLVVDAGDGYRGVDGDSARLVSELLAAYKLRRTAVIAMIFGQS